MKVNNNNKKGSNAKKIIPAAGMLSVSAVMLASSTFAWFTMSKEVSITGIQMTASVPEDIQLSLGHGMNSGTGLKTTTSGDTLATFVESNGVRTLTLGDPSTASGTTDWSNTVAVSDYYTFGRLTPATSKDGNNIYFTKDAVSAGKALPDDNTNTNTVSNAFINKAFAVFSTATNTGSMRGWMTPKATPATADTTTISKDKNGFAYYADIPVWFRTSTAGTAGQTVDLAVTASFTANTAGDPDIYKAARCALIPSGGSSVGAIMDSETEYYHKAGTDTGTAVLDASGVAPSSAVTVTGANTTAKATWELVDPVVQATVTDGFATAGDKVVSIPVSTTEGSYGTIAPYTLRVWIEGEDVNCWNESAAQDFQIDLKFTRYSALGGSSGTGSG